MLMMNCLAEPRVAAISAGAVTSATRPSAPKTTVNVLPTRSGNVPIAIGMPLTFISPLACSYVSNAVVRPSASGEAVVSVNARVVLLVTFIVGNAEACPAGASAGTSGTTSAAVSPDATAVPTFTRDVAPILQEKCQACHRDGYIAPMSLVTYEQTRPWARSIKARVAARQMPPWHIDQTVGIQQFKNDRSLTDDQIDTLVRWVDAGAPKGDPKDMPPPKQWPDEAVWNFAAQFGQPDLIVKSPQYTMPAVALDAWYKPVVETGLTETRWVRAIEIRPSTLKGRKITHHALARLQQAERSADGPSAPGDDAGSAGLFMEWAVGKQGEIMRPNSGKLMLPGSKIIFEVHYHAVGEAITDSVELGIYFYPKGQEPKYRQTLGLFSSIAGGSRNIDIAPNSTFV